MRLGEGRRGRVWQVEMVDKGGEDKIGNHSDATKKTEEEGEEMSIPNEP